MKKNKYWVWLGLMILLLVIGTSYALWQLTLIQTESNIVNTTCFKIAFKDENAITLQNSYPITDEEGMSLTPYTFTIENICDTNATYQINLENLRVEGKELSDEYLKLSLNEEKSKILNTLPEVSPTIPNADVSHKLTTGVLKAGEKKEFFLRLWMDEDTPPLDEVMNASHESKITVTLIHKETIPEVTTLASEYLDGIKIQNNVSNLGNDVLTYFYKLDDGEEIVSDDANYTFTGLNDGTYHVGIRIENQDGIIIKEEMQDVVIAYEHVYVSSSGNDTTGIGSMDNPYATLQPAYNKVKSGGEVLLLSDITATSTTNMNIENKEITLKSNSENTYSIFRGDSFASQIIDVSNANILTTTNIILDGLNKDAQYALIYIQNSTLNLKKGSILQNNVNNGSAGGAILCYWSNMNIDGANILNNRAIQAGGIIIILSTAVIENTLIKNNSTTGNGGGIGMNGANVTLNNTRIEANSAKEAGGGVFITSDARQATLYMNNGAIANNTAQTLGGGVFAMKGTSGASAVAYINSGTINNNTATTGPNTYSYNGGQIIDQR